MKLIPFLGFDGNTHEAMAFYAKALGAGGSRPWMTPDDVRDLEDMNPMGGNAALLLDPVNIGGGAPHNDDEDDDKSKDEDDEQ